VVLEGAPLPATRDALVAYASRHDRDAADALMRIPDREYAFIDEVGEELARTHPAPPAAEPLPRPESGGPPGGSDYTNPQPVSGQVDPAAPPDYPASKQIEAQAETLKKQQSRQEG
jgi:hypothetical protein